MDSCPAELIALILEHMPLVDLEKTARNLGLVSKYYRKVAKPFEFRALVIIGSEQLKTTLGRIEMEQVEREDGAIIDVRHLFICEMEQDIDIGIDTGGPDNLSVESMDEVKKYWATIGKCRDYANELREYAAILIRNVHTTLVTLSIIQRFRKFSCGFEGPSIISGLYFPRLENLIFEHNADISDFDFVRPTAPLLRRIHLSAFRMHNLLGALGLRNLPEIRDGTLLLHPLLMNMHTRFKALTHLVLCGGGLDSVDDLLAVLCGSVNGAKDFKSMLPTNRGLPGRLVHAVLKPWYQHDREGVLRFCKDARALCIDGLEVRAPHFVPYEIGVRERNDEILEEFEGLARERW
ncbi:hypothetical protein M0805_008246 [Coniferiporia weirii]|nr:hypothetical protein M0805_008246 [Coniferiporia weirii]